MYLIYSQLFKVLLFPEHSTLKCYKFFSVNCKSQPFLHLFDWWSGVYVFVLCTRQLILNCLLYIIFSLHRFTHFNNICYWDNVHCISDQTLNSYPSLKPCGVKTGIHSPVAFLFVLVLESFQNSISLYRRLSIYIAYSCVFRMSCWYKWFLNVNKHMYSVTIYSLITIS